jgi:hypothetical protein
MALIRILLPYSSDLLRDLSQCASHIPRAAGSKRYLSALGGGKELLLIYEAVDRKQ